MFFFFAFIAGAIVIAVLIGGDVRRLSRLRLKSPLLVLTAFAAKAAVAVLGTTHDATAVLIARPLNVGGAALLLGAVWFNRRTPGAYLFGLGLALNLAALVAYGGRMPVLLPHDIDPASPRLALLSSGFDPLHELLTTPRGPWFLGDILPIPGLNGHGSVVSVGDLLMAAGIGWLIIRCSLRQPALRPAYGPSPTS